MSDISQEFSVSVPRCRLSATDMSPMMQDFVEQTALYAVDNIEELRAIADYIRAEFTQQYGGAWHCIVGYQFTTDITPAADSFIFFYVDALAVLLWKVPSAFCQANDGRSF